MNDLARWDSWQIIAEPFLDTSVNQDWRITARAELKQRGISGFNLYARIAFAATGLWWNIFWWEWAVFGLKDILFGWALNTLAIIAIVIGVLWHWYAGVAAFVPLLVLVTWIARKIASKKSVD